LNTGTSNTGKRYKPLPRPRGERILRIILALIVLVIAGVSIPALAAKREARINAASDDNANGNSAMADNAVSPEKIWTGIGRIRAPLGAATKTGAQTVGSPTPATVVIAVNFPYDSTDRAWTEELALNNRKFREEIIAYFSRLQPNDILDESRIKEDLLARFNKLLRLNKIKTIYFSEFMVID
jgi:flagellar basal body-associated protein FliL